MIDYSEFLDSLEKSELKPWLKCLPKQIDTGLSTLRFGDLEKWMSALTALPNITPSHIELGNKVSVGKKEDTSAAQRTELFRCLKTLQPWRKGPFEIFDILIDTEWRSDRKWERLLPHISPLKNKRVLDVGCGNGYHCWRMLGAGAQQVIGIDPSPRFVVQFYMLKKYLAYKEKQAVDVLPLRIQDLPENLRAFDTVFSMGVLYHRRSPMDHLTQLRDALKSSGELVLETLIIDGGLGQTLVPKDRYAKMRNVWFIPSAPTLISWLEKCGFNNVRCVDKNITNHNEQRKTDWMDSQSLIDFLDPEDQSRTIEGYPAPLRGIFIASRT